MISLETGGINDAVQAHGIESSEMSRYNTDGTTPSTFPEADTAEIERQPDRRPNNHHHYHTHRPITTTTVGLAKDREDGGDNSSIALNPPTIDIEAFIQHVYDNFEVVSDTGTVTAGSLADAGAGADDDQAQQPRTIFYRIPINGEKRLFRSVL